MSYYPILLDLQNERVVVVGGGKVGERKVISLLKAKARVQLVSREITPLLRDLAQSSLIEYLGPEFREDLLDGAKIVIAATDDEGLNRRIFEVCRQKGIWINVVDDPSLCSFLVPSVIQRGSLILAVSTGGKSPAFSKFLRETIEKILPKGIEPLLELMGLLRERVIGLNMGPEKNNELFNKIVRSELGDLLEKKDLDGTIRLLGNLLPKELDTTGLYEEIKTLLERN